MVMPDQKITNLLGLARGAGKLALGNSAVEKALARGRADLLIFARDASSRLRVQLQRQAARCPLRVWSTKERLGSIFQRQELAVLAVLDRHFASGLLPLLSAEQQDGDVDGQATVEGASIVQQKEKLRKMILHRRARLEPGEKKRLSRRIIAHLEKMPELLTAHVIHTYVALPQEVQNHQFVRAMLRRGKKIVVPRVRPGTAELQHFCIDDFDDLRPGTFGILEPAPDRCQPVNVGAIEAVIVPGVAFDQRGNRLGFGKGFYDRFLQDEAAFKIGLAFEVQMLPQIPVHPQDVPMDAIVTEKGVLRMARG